MTPIARPHDLPVVCSPSAFTADERTAHDALLVTAVLGRAVARRELEDGVELRYLVDRTIGPALMAWLVEERRCCPFLTFELRVAAGDDQICLTVRGPDGTLEALRVAFAASGAR